MSSDKTNHDYHLVDPSPWPLFASIGALILCFGSVFYFRSDNPWVMIGGLSIVIYVAYMWFRDIVNEGEHEGHHTQVVQLGLRYGMVLFIASEVMLSLIHI